MKRTKKKKTFGIIQKLLVDLFNTKVIKTIKNRSNLGLNWVRFGPDDEKRTKKNSKGRNILFEFLQKEKICLRENS